MQRHRRLTVRLGGTLILASGILSLGAILSGSPSATAQGSGTLAGYTASLQAVGVQFGFNVPTLLPVDGNLVEEDLPFARTTVGNGPNIAALATPYYPGDIAASLGSLVAEFAPPGTPSVPNDPVLAEAEYPTSPGHEENESFGGTAPAGLPLSPSVASGTAHAGTDGANAVATLTDLTVGTGASILDVGSIQSTNAFDIGSSTVTGTASTLLRSIDIAGLVDIDQLSSNSSSSSDGNQGTPTSSLQIGKVTVAGQNAYIDATGVHVGTAGTPTSVTAQTLQQVVDTTFATDGISIRLLNPTETTNGAEGIANSGGLVVSVSHPFTVPYIPGEPTIPLPVLGNQGLPAGTYTAVTSITLGSAATDVTASPIPAATVIPPLAGAVPGLSTAFGPSGFGFGGISSPETISPGSSTQTVAPVGPGTGLAHPSTGLTATLLPLRPFGLPAPVGWIIVAVVLCVVFMYPMLMLARWQFLGRRRH
jgi:hypothetical protein